MNGPASLDVQAAAGPRESDRVRAAVVALGAAVLGAAPHVLHHVP